jgi:phosphatidylglycerophosphate synthase
MRSRFQNPRRGVDTWYGRHVMRRFSIYVTALCLKFAATPNQVTLLSLCLALAGCLALAKGLWGWGILLLNLWYLMDHVDGELSRALNASSATGYFFDTIVNIFAQPLTFLALGWGLGLLPLGVLGCFSYAMLCALPWCEATILFHQGVRIQDSDNSKKEGTKGWLKEAFGGIHKLTAFPSFLVIATMGSILMGSMGSSLHEIFIQGIFYFYVGLSTFVWITLLTHKISTRSLDRLQP